MGEKKKANKILYVATICATASNPNKETEACQINSTNCVQTQQYCQVLPFKGYPFSFSSLHSLTL